MALVARLDDWRLRASSWPPHGGEPVPVAELAVFLASVRAELKRLSKSDVAAAWGAWASCMGALARSPHVLVSDAGEQLLACALCVLYKANADDVRDEALHAECKRIEWWCAQFVRHLGGGPASSSPAGVMDCVVADLRAGGEDDQKAQLREEMGRRAQARAQGYGWPIVARQLLDFYAETIERQQPRRLLPHTALPIMSNGA